MRVTLSRRRHAPGLNMVDSLSRHWREVRGCELGCARLRRGGWGPASMALGERIAQPGAIRGSLTRSGGGAGSCCRSGRERRECLQARFSAKVLLLDGAMFAVYHRDGWVFGVSVRSRMDAGRQLKVVPHVWICGGSARRLAGLPDPLPPSRGHSQGKFPMEAG